MVKQEPIGRIKDRKYEKKRERAEKKEAFKKGVCIRCGDKWTKSHMEKCPAKTKKCNICKKEGHIAKVCKSDQKKAQIRRVEEEDSSDSEESDSNQSESEKETSSAPENNTSSDSFEERNEKHRKRAQRCEKENQNIEIERARIDRK